MIDKITKLLDKVSIELAIEIYHGIGDYIEHRIEEQKKETDQLQKKLKKEE